MLRFLPITHRHTVGVQCTPWGQHNLPTKVFMNSQGTTNHFPPRPTVLALFCSFWFVLMYYNIYMLLLVFATYIEDMYGGVEFQSVLNVDAVLFTNIS